MSSLGHCCLCLLHRGVFAIILSHINTIPVHAQVRKRALPETTEPQQTPEADTTQPTQRKPKRAKHAKGDNPAPPQAHAHESADDVSAHEADADYVADDSEQIAQQESGIPGQKTQSGNSIEVPNSGPNSILDAIAAHHNLTQVRGLGLKHLRA